MREGGFLGQLAIAQIENLSCGNLIIRGFSMLFLKTIQTAHLSIYIDDCAGPTGRRLQTAAYCVLFFEYDL